MKKPPDKNKNKTEDKVVDKTKIKEYEKSLTVYKTIKTSLKSIVNRNGCISKIKKAE